MTCTVSWKEATDTCRLDHVGLVSRVLIDGESDGGRPTRSRRQATPQFEPMAEHPTWLAGAHAHELNLDKPGSLKEDR